MNSIYEITYPKMTIQLCDEYINVIKIGLFNKTKNKIINYEGIDRMEIKKNLGLESLYILTKKVTDSFTINLDLKDFNEICVFLEEKTGKNISDSLGVYHKLKKSNKKDTTKDITCPKCSSTQFMAGNQKFSGKRAIVGGLIAGPLGALVGSTTSKKVKITCLNCGHSWTAGDQ